MERSNILQFVIIVLITSTLFISAVKGNPLPMDVEWRGTGGGHPVPDRTPIPIFLKEEFVKAVIKDGTADMTCIYIFKNNAEIESVVNITLPFVKEPTGLKLWLDGEETNFGWGFHEYEPLNEWTEHMMEYTGGLLESIRFQIHIEGGEEFEVKVEYNTPISVYDSRSLGGDLSYWYCYLVGTGSEWGHPIEKARFEVRIPSRMYSEHESETWEKHMTISKVVFEKEYQNWTPSTDLIILRWKKTDPVPIPNELKAGCCFSIIGIEVLLIAMVIFISKRKKRRIRSIEE